MKQRRADVGIRIRADETFARLIDRAAELCGTTRSAFIRDAALARARAIISDAAIGLDPPRVAGGLKKCTT